MIIIDIAMTIFPPFAMIPQYLIIKEKKSMGTFSIYIPAILLIANILRVFFWLTAGFAFNLLIQSLLMIVMQLVLLKECVDVSDYSIKESSFWQSFWRWNTYEQYIKFLLGLTAVMTIVTLLIQIFTFGYFGQVIGLVSMTIEATLGFPQAISNWRNRSVEGLSIQMILMWFLGDFCKTVYFLVQKQPFQFILCGIIQLTVDIVILAQIIFYGKANQYDSVKHVNDS